MERCSMSPEVYLLWLKICVALRKFGGPTPKGFPVLFRIDEVEAEIAQLEKQNQGLAQSPQSASDTI